MGKNIIKFLDAYKLLDELCKQRLQSDIGVTEYIAQMDRNFSKSSLVSDWEAVYKQLKHLRYVRNKLVHEADSFNEKLFSPQDILWLVAFRKSILKQTDPLAVIYKSGKSKNKTSKIDIAAPTTAQQSNNNIPAGILLVIIAAILLIVFLTK